MQEEPIVRDLPDPEIAKDPIPIVDEGTFKSDDSSSSSSSDDSAEEEAEKDDDGGTSSEEKDVINKIKDIAKPVET